MDFKGLIKEVEYMLSTNQDKGRLEGIKQTTEAFDGLQIGMALTKEERNDITKLKELLGLK